MREISVYTTNAVGRNTIYVHPVCELGFLHGHECYRIAFDFLFSVSVYDGSVPLLVNPRKTVSELERLLSPVLD